MSFVFPSWSTAFSPAFHEDAKGMLEAALNKGNKPPVIQGRIEVVELSMGTQPPTLTLLEIGDLSLDRFRGILRLGYQGDAWLEVRCRVQANPLSHNPNLLPSSTLPLSTPLLASQPLLVPMTLRLSLLHLRAILILVVSASKGITLVFKNDPLQNVDVSSTFDSVEVIRGYLQQEIEGQLREMFREDLPGIIHRLSQRWFTGSGVGGKVELPYRDGDYASSTVGTSSRTNDEEEDEVDPNDPHAEREIFPPYVPSPSINLTPRRKALQKAARARRLSTAASDSPTSYTVFPDIEDYDPTYGLRPEGLPTHSGYEAFGRLWEKAREGEGRGLGGLMDNGLGSHARDDDRGDVSDGDWDEDEDNETSRSFDMVEMEESLQAIGGGPGRLSRRHSGRRRTGTMDSVSRYGDEDAVEWETFPAVGGGVVTRPRVYHSQSRIRAPSEAGGVAMPSPSGTGTGGSVTARASSVGAASSTIGSLRTRTFTPLPTPGIGGPMYRAQGGPGPSSLRRLATSRSDVFLSGHHVSRSESFSPSPAMISAPHLKSSHSYRQSLSRLHSGLPAPSTGARTSGSSWDRDTYDSNGHLRSNSSTTPASSQLPSSRSMSIDMKSTSKSNGHNRTPSFAGTSTGTSFPPRNIGPGGFTLPLNNSVSQLATLSHSNQTLSPYARGHEHIAVRSFPYLGKSGASSSSASGGINSSTLGAAGVGGNFMLGGRDNGGGDDGSRVKAKRKRIYRIGSSSSKPKESPLSPDLDDTPPAGDTYDDGQSRRFSSSSDGVGSGQAGLLSAQRQWQSGSLVGAAQRVMRPQLGRGDSRTSYGFPPVSHFGKIAE